jgi:uncharacterized glyoxalase superfamily metalloenzyme YdcJ
VYEDFLPRSAAGIFRSNLSSEGTRNDVVDGIDYDSEQLSSAVGARISDPQALYRDQRVRSVAAASVALGLEIEDDELPSVSSGPVS